jgi:hypothetical protein
MDALKAFTCGIVAVAVIVVGGVVAVGWHLAEMVLDHE